MYRRKGGDLVMHVYYHVCGVVALVEEDVFVFDQRVGHWLGLDELGVHALEDIGQVVVVAGEGEELVPVVAVEPEDHEEAIAEAATLRWRRRWEWR